MKFFDKNWTIFAIDDQQKTIKKISNYLKFGVSDLFLNVEMETSSRCNRKCSYCPNSVYDRGDHLMSESLFKSIINQLKELGFEGNIRPHFYNEPLLDKRLPAFLRYVKATLPKASIHIYTNGDFLTKDLFKELVSSGVSKMIVTSHSGFMSKSIKDLLATAKGKKIIHHQFITKDKLMWNRGGTVKVANSISLSKCPIPSLNLTVNYRGQVVLCCNDPRSQNVLGDLNKEKIIDVWKNPKNKKLRKDIGAGIFNLPICQRCVHR